MKTRKGLARHAAISLVLIVTALAAVAFGAGSASGLSDPDARLALASTPAPALPTTQTEKINPQVSPLQGPPLSTTLTGRADGGRQPSDPPAETEVRQESTITLGAQPPANPLPKPPSALKDEIHKPGADSGSSLDTPKTGDPVSHIAPEGWGTIMTESFEGAFPTGAWDVYDLDGATNGEYYWDDDDYKPYTGTWSAWPANGGANALDPASYYYADNMSSWMVYGPFDLSDATDAELSFYYWNDSEVSFDWFWWTHSGDGSNFTGYKTSGTSSGWQYVNFDLSSRAGDPSVWIAFIFTSDVSGVYDGPFVDDVVLDKYTVAAQPNLAPYTPAGWDYPIVPSSVTGTNTVNTLYTSQNTYIDWAAINTGATTGTTFTSCLYYDNSQIQCWNTAGLIQNYYAYVQDWLLNLTPTAGSHNLRLVVDVNNNVTESNEGDNTWNGDFTWNTPDLPNLVPYQPTGWDYPIVPSSVTGTHTVDTLNAAGDTYVDWAVMNSGTSTGTTFMSCLYFDNSQMQCWNTPDGLNQFYYAYVEDWLMSVTPTAGAHTLKLTVDVNNNVTEANEGDNTWQRSFTWVGGCPASSYSGSRDGAAAGSPLINDVLPLPASIQQEIGPEHVASHAPGPHDTAVYMTGKVAVGIILPESTGSGENWTDVEKACVVQKIQAGMNWWKNRGGPAADLTFVYDTHLGVSTTYEPIQQTTGNQGLWIGDTLANMGYPEADYWEKVYSYVNHIKDVNDADWGFAFLVADSTNDPDGAFAGGPYFAYTYLGGPFVIMTLDNDGWGLGNMNWVATHETGHVFRAGDQYYAPGYGGCTSTTQRYGYLGIANSNCEYNNPNSVPSIMRSNEDALDTSAKEQIGWKDSNSNGVLDPIDTYPAFSLAQYTPDPTPNTTLAYSGSVYDNPWPHAVCGAGDACFTKDLTVQTITSVQYRVDGGSWLNVTPVDGSFNSDYEQITFTTAPLGDGLHTIDVLAVNSKGRATGWQDQVTVAGPKLLTVSKTGSGSGTVTSSPAGINCGADCSESYTYNTTVTLTASAATGSAFTGWSGACSGTGSCVVTMTAARSVTANFDIVYHTLNVSKTGTGSGTVTSSPGGINCGADCSESYAYGTTVTLTAGADAGSTFTGWGGACSGTGSCVVTMTAARSVTANFNINYYSLSVSKSGSGTVTSDPAGINCGADCSEGYAYNTTVTLYAAAAPGSTFTGWGGACAGTGSCVVTMTAARSVSATFTVNQYSLSVNKTGTGSGTVTSSPAGINCGLDCSQNYLYNTVVTLTAVAAPGSTFTGWGGACSGTGQCVVTMSSPQAVTANFDLISRLLTVTKTGTGSGTVTSDPAGIDCGADCSESYPHGTVVTLYPSADPGSTFIGWGGACSGTGSCVVTMTAARSVTANFNAILYPLTVSKTGTGSGIVTSDPAGINCGADCSQSYAYNTMVTLNASGAPGSTFTGWGGACSGTDPCVVTMDSAKSVTAEFTVQLYSLYVFPAGTGSGTVTSSPAGINCGADCWEEYAYYTTVTLTAAPAAGSVFAGWDDPACPGTGKCVLLMTEAKYVTANFIPQPPVITETYRSVGTQDGWVLEMNETSNTGGSMNGAATTFAVGDDALDRQQKGILSFNTAALPDNAVITSVTLKFKSAGVTGTLPFLTHGNLIVDVRKGGFGGSPALQALDFQAAGSKNAVMTITNNPVSGWYTKAMGAANFTYINKTGVTQFRLRFANGDNDDGGVDVLKLYSGNYATASARPQLIIKYYVLP